MATSLTLSLKRAPSTTTEINSIFEQTTKPAPAQQKQQSLPVQIPVPQTQPSGQAPPTQQAPPPQSPAPQNPAPQNPPPKK
jgi:hypothetical protein